MTTAVDSTFSEKEVKSYTYKYRVSNITTRRATAYEHRTAFLVCISDLIHWATRPELLKWDIPPECDWQPEDVIVVSAMKETRDE
jgi:hypothetical protein